MKNITIALLVISLVFAMVSFAQDETPVAIKKVAAIYPKAALDKKIEGKVWVEITLYKDGTVSTAKVSKTDNEILNEAALNAAVQWVFQPLKSETKVTLPFNFKLSE